VISTEARPRLAPKVRLRFDRRGERWMLLWPEKGMVLNPTAADIVQLCTGDHTVGAIVARLAEKYTTETHDGIERQVTDFLNALADRGLMDGVR
jgi:coenzyme PQQ biosynthesis protein PqqD